MTSWFTIARVLPDYLSLNGSSANADIVATSLRHLGHEVTIVDVNDPADAVSSVDLVCIGSGSGSTMRPAATALIGLVRILNQWQSSGARVFTHGLGWDLLGSHVILPDGEKVPGAGVIPSSADLRAPRYSGEVSGRDYRGRESAGYVNSIGVSIREDGVKPLCSIEFSAGDFPAEEGLVTDSVMATRIGGPALALNPHWCADIVSGMLASRGLTYETSTFHARVEDAASRARALIKGRLQAVSSR